jgi:hypothetical protein
MDMPIESVERKDGRAVPVVDYAKAEREWLQKKRIELNAMTTEEFIAWLDRKMAPFLRGVVPAMVIPPDPVMADRLAADVKATVRERIVADVLRAAGVDRRVEEAFAALLPTIQAKATALSSHVAAVLAEKPDEPWTAPVARLAQELGSAGA